MFISEIMLCSSGAACQNTIWPSSRIEIGSALEITRRVDVAAAVEGKGIPHVARRAAHSTAMEYALDAEGNVYTTGSFRGTIDFDPGGDWNEFLGQRADCQWRLKRNAGALTDYNRAIASRPRGQ